MKREDAIPSQHCIEQALLGLRPAATSWGATFVCGVPVRRLDRPGAWYHVGMYEGDVLREGDGGVLDLMDAAHAVRLGLGRHEPRFERIRCDVCEEDKRGRLVWACPVCAVTVCNDCHNGHVDSHEVLQDEVAA